MQPARQVLGLSALCGGRQVLESRISGPIQCCKSLAASKKKSEGEQNPHQVNLRTPLSISRRHSINFPDPLKPSTGYHRNAQGLLAIITDVCENASRLSVRTSMGLLRHVVRRSLLQV